MASRYLPDGNRRQPISVVVRPELRRLVDEQAEAEDRSLGWVVEKALEFYYANRQPPNPPGDE
jgi:predicted transcriptional regulator